MWKAGGMSAFPVLQTGAPPGLSTPSAGQALPVNVLQRKWLLPEAAVSWANYERLTGAAPREPLANLYFIKRGTRPGNTLRACTSCYAPGETAGGEHFRFAETPDRADSREANAAVHAGRPKDKLSAG